MASRETGANLPKTFSVPMGRSEMSDEDRSIIEARNREVEEDRQKTLEETRKRLIATQAKKKTKKLIPYGTRLLVKRRKVDQVSIHIILPDETAGMPTDIADVVATPDQSFCDKELIANSEAIILGLSKRAQEGDGQAFKALLEFNEYLRVVTLKPGDTLMIGKYIGTDFLIQETNQYLTVMDGSGIYCKVVEI